MMNLDEITLNLTENFEIRTNDFEVFIRFPFRYCISFLII